MWEGGLCVLVCLLGFMDYRMMKGRNDYGEVFGCGMVCDVFGE